MRIALSWLRQMVRIDAEAAQIAHLLTMGGLEVEDLVSAPAFSQVVVARVDKVERHPNADRLSVCQVDTGDPVPRTVVCGAPNVAPGLFVPCALPGALLPGGLAIKASTMRGVRSEGMLCSARELGLSDDAQGLMVLEAGATPGADLRAWLDLDDPVFEIKMTPNRGDCLSALGVARELAALSGAALQPPDIEAVAADSPERLPVHIEAAQLCGRFSGRIVRGLNARAPTPAWMRRRIEQAGQRPISALVDISNFVMLELGQPSHVFDLAKVRGDLTVRWARPGERITLLNDATVDLDPTIGVVADGAGAEAVAGIMGGLSTSVTLDTTDIYIEAAFWWPDAIQGRARGLAIPSEAAHRFERGVDFAGTGRALERLTRLVVQICGTPATRVAPIDDNTVRLPQREAVALRADRLARVLGVAVPAARVREVFDRLGMPCAEAAGGTLLVTPPSYRFDIEREEDLIEEVARVVGYDAIPAEPPLARARMHARPEGARGDHDLRRVLAGAGYQEVVNYGFVPHTWETQFGADPARTIRVVNPIAVQHGVMRSGLCAGLVENLRYNLNRQATRVRIFELARVFQRDAAQAEGPAEVAGIAQPRHVAALAYGAVADEQWGMTARGVDFFDVKGDLERLLLPRVAHFAALAPDAPGAGTLHPGRSATVLLDGATIGWIGELHPRLCRSFELPGAPIVFEVAVQPLLQTGLPHLHDVPRFPGLVRDIAVWVDAAVPAGDVLEDLRGLAARSPELAAVREVRLFDVFRRQSGTSEDASAEGASGLLNKEKSLAFRFVLQDTERSLAEADADAARAAIVRHLMQRWGGRERQ
jgi:phenylalanyl-tRNA synthetase beta chain